MAEYSGKVITAHCDCMSGKSECCSHVAAILFASEAACRMHSSTTCTQTKSQWLMPGYVKEIPYAAIEEIDFTSAKKKHSQLLEDKKVPTALRNSDEVVQRPLTITSYEEQLNFFQKISLSDSKPAILSLISPYNTKYIPKGAALPQPLTHLYDANATELNYDELLSKCIDISLQISITDEEIKAIEEGTREQASTNVWYKQRAGRITASNFKSACHTNISRPSPSLIKRICYPESTKFSSAATAWGCKNETNARKAYLEKTNRCHDDFSICDSGLQINKQWPHIGASPDGLVNCKCCGAGVCEIKCPYSAKDLSPTDPHVISDKNYCLQNDSDSIYLNRTHAYYYQVQCQMFICNVEYCDFIVWTPHGLYVERIMPDVEFWSASVAKVTEFFKIGILPEIVGKLYTRPSLPSTLVAPSPDDDSAEWCICQRYIEDSTLVGCDNDDCKVKWFHLQCLRLKNPPKGRWLCMDCQKLD